MKVSSTYLQLFYFTRNIQIIRIRVPKFILYICIKQKDFVTQIELCK